MLLARKFNSCVFTLHQSFSLRHVAERQTPQWRLDLSAHLFPQTPSTDAMLSAASGNIQYLN